MRRTVSLYFIRHGQALHNVAAEKYGEYAYFDPIYTDANLTEMGIKQSVDLQFCLKKNNPDIVFSSSLRRCLQTLDHALVDYNKEIMVDDRLAERLGQHPCNKRSPRNLLNNIINRKLNLNNVINENNWLSKRETDDEMIERALDWYYDILKYLENNKNIKNVAVFSHYDFLTTVLSKGLPISSALNGRPFNNAEIRKIILYL